MLHYVAAALAGALFGPQMTTRLSGSRGPLQMAAGGAEAALFVILVTLPSNGALLVATLLIVYGLYLRFGKLENSCDCTGWLDFPIRALNILRNAVCAAVFLLIALAIPTYYRPRPGAQVVMVAMAVGSAWLVMRKAPVAKATYPEPLPRQAENIK